MMKILLLLLLSVGVLVAGPFVTIWSMNTLFGLGISYTFKSWLAVCWLSLIIFGGINNLKK